MFLYIGSCRMSHSCDSPLTEDFYKNGKLQFHNYYDSRYVNLTLIWKFGNIFNKSKNYFDSSNSEERDRL